MNKRDIKAAQKASPSPPKPNKKSAKKETSVSPAKGKRRVAAEPEGKVKALKGDKQNVNLKKSPDVKKSTSLKPVKASASKSKEKKVADTPTKPKKTVKAQKVEVEASPEPKKAPKKKLIVKEQKKKEKDQSPEWVEPEQHILPKGSGQYLPKQKKGPYMFFSQVMNPKIREEYEIPLTEASKRVGQIWQTMDEKARKPYINLSAIDQGRFNDQMKSLETKGYFMMADGQKSSDLHKPEKDEQRPKKTMTSYMSFLKITVPDLMREKKLTMLEASKETSELWKKMTNQEKKPFESKSKKDQLRHDKQAEEFKRKGYFTLADGTKSCDLKKKVKRVKRNSEPPLEKRSPKKIVASPVKKATKVPASQNSPAKVARKSTPKKLQKTQ